MIPVCHVQVLPILSGAQRSMIETFAQIDRRRYELHVACQGAGPMTDELERIGVRWHAVPSLVRPIHPWRDVHAYRELYRLFQREQFQLVHTHSSKPGLLGRLAARRAGVPKVVHHVHAFAFHEYSPRWKWWFYGGLERWAAGYCDRMLFVNHEERQMSVDRGWIPAAQAITIYNGVDLAATDPRRRQPIRDTYRRRWGLTDDETAILCIGRIDYPKQPPMLPRIAAEIEKLSPRGAWRLLVAGSGPEEPALRRLVERMRMEHRVGFLGWQEDPLGVLHGADIMLQTSLAEGLPRVLIEGHAAGLPTVASDAKGNREVVVEETGFLCPPKDPAEFARALARLIDGPYLRAAMGRAARRRAESLFDTVATGRQLAAFYDELFGVNVEAVRRAA